MGNFMCPYCEEELITNECCGKDFTEEIAASKKDELLQYQIDQQDKIDNACLQLIEKFVVKWDIEQINSLRAALISVLEDYGKREYDIYPWILERSL